MQKAHFILADNQELTRLALETLIGGEADFSFSTARDKAELTAQLVLHPESVVVLDYTLFDIDGDASLLIIGERFGGVAWLLLSDDLTEAFLRNVVFASRRFSVVFKDSPLKTVREALYYAARGDRYVCPRATEMLLFKQQDERDGAQQLTHTEIEVLTAIAQGKTTKEIAAERYSSIHTINTHRKNIFRKLKVNTAHEAVKYAFRAGLVDPSEFYI